MNKTKRAYILNIITFAIITFSVIWMYSGIHFGNAPRALSGSRLSMLKFYTVDSNIIMGVVALITALEQKKIIEGKLEKLPVWCYILNLVGVVGVTLTMLVTVFYLTPLLGFIMCFNNSNFFLHLVNPILSIVTFIGFENSKEIAFKHTFTGIVTMIIYAVYYCLVSVVNSTNGFVNEGYDWYGFFAWGLKIGFTIVVPLIIVITYIISLCLWRFNRRK